MKAVIVGTAGHIDHGKSALVRALTGTDPDRLEEEKRRGITIDIGFANLDLTSPDRRAIRIGFVDVPGHERFVRNMLAGVGGIDLVLLVIAADEGIKPQTREHFDICRMLAIQRGITVLTKSDLVDADILDAMHLQVLRLEVADFLKGSFLDPASSPIVAVSAKTGAGLDRLQQRAGTIGRGDSCQGFQRRLSSAHRSRLQHERLRHGCDRHADFRDSSQRAGTRGPSHGQATASSRRAGARCGRGAGHRRTTYRAEPGRSGDC